ncbi:uncharacterized protein DS421_18g634570 [Arachis hypogaea]|nr:uncharacterized protein DS421_18g634570 [Arachis hypogaea]
MINLYVLPPCRAISFSSSSGQRRRRTQFLHIVSTLSRDSASQQVEVEEEIEEPEEVIPILSSKAVMVEKAFNLAAQKMGFKFVSKNCTILLHRVEEKVTWRVCLPTSYPLVKLIEGMLIKWFCIRMQQRNNCWSLFLLFVVVN